MFEFLKKKTKTKTIERVSSSQMKDIAEGTLITSANSALIFQGEKAATTVNAFDDKASQISAIKERYYGMADYGNELMKRIIDILSSQQIGNSIELTADDSPEKTYIEEFIDHNNLREGEATQLAKEGVMQGQVLIKLIWNPEINMVETNYMPWDQFKYFVAAIGNSNVNQPYEVRFADPAAGVIPNDDIAVCFFNRKLYYKDNIPYIEGYPILGGIIQRIDDISKDLNDWRTSNKLYSHPTPYFKCEGKNEANQIVSTITEKGWKVGTAMAASAEFSMIVPDNYWETISMSILNNLKIISGSTGLAIAWLGFPDVMSNRSTAESLGEPLELVSQANLTTWVSFYEMMFDNVIKMRNKNIQSSQMLKTGKVKPDIKSSSDRKWKQLVEFYMPAADANLISVRTMLEKIPGFRGDIDEELEKIKEERDERMPNTDVTRQKPGGFEIDGEPKSDI